ncbi:MAG TPA: hypothetical protein VJH69_01830 [Candidatus Paceibacterota bacterium]
MRSKLKYGENPHQKASFQKHATSDSLAISKFKRSDGSEFPDKDSSWIAITDLGRLILTAERFVAAYRINVGSPPPALAVIVKHGSPCGAAFGNSPQEATREAWKGDPQAAFGGFLLCTFPFTKEMADVIKNANGGRMPFLSVAAPALEEGIESYVGAKANTRYFISNHALSAIPDSPASHQEIKSVRELILEQEPSHFIPDFKKMEQHGKTISGPEESRILADLSLAFAVCSSSNSNTVTLVKNRILIGNAVGQQKRVGSARLALELARENGHDTNASVAVSDSFFPFPDGLEVLASAGIQAIFATSGSLRDKEVFAAAERSSLTLFTVSDKEGRMFSGH